LEHRRLVANNLKEPVKCNKCGHVGLRSTFPTGNDFFQNVYIRGCPNPKCDNSQSPGDASMRGFGGSRPFTFVQSPETDGTVIGEVMKRANEAS